MSLQDTRSTGVIESITLHGMVCLPGDARLRRQYLWLSVTSSAFWKDKDLVGRSSHSSIAVLVLTYRRTYRINLYSLTCIFLS